MFGSSELTPAISEGFLRQDFDARLVIISDGIPFRPVHRGRRCVSIRKRWERGVCWTSPFSVVEIRRRKEAEPVEPTRGHREIKVPNTQQNYSRLTL